MYKYLTLLLLLLINSLSWLKAQNSLNKELTIGFGYTKSYNQVIQDADRFYVKGIPNLRAYATWEQSIMKIKLGVGFEFYNTYYEYKERNFINNRTSNSVGLYYHSGGYAKVLALSISAKCQLYSNRYYKLNAKLSPKIGYAVKNFYFKYISDTRNGYLTQGESGFSDYIDKWRYKSIFPLLAFEIENELKLAKRSGLVFTIGYQQGFKTYMMDPMMYIQDHKTLNEKIEYFTVKNKGNMLFYQISYRHYF